MSPSSEREERSPDLQSASGGGRHTRCDPRLWVSKSESDLQLMAGLASLADEVSQPRQPILFKYIFTHDRLTQNYIITSPKPECLFVRRVTKKNTSKTKQKLAYRLVFCLVLLMFFFRDSSDKLAFGFKASSYKVCSRSLKCIFLRNYLH